MKAKTSLITLGSRLWIAYLRCTTCAWSLSGAAGRADVVFDWDNAATKVGFGSLDQQMKMIVHQHVRMNSDGEAFGCLSQQLQEMEPVGVVAVDGFTLVTTGRSW